MSPSSHRRWRRARAGAALTATRARLRVLEAVAPAAAGRAAVDLWCTYPAGGRSRDLRPSPGTVRRLPAVRAGDVVVETWLLPANPWHLRVHRIVTPRELHATEGGFAVARADGNTDICVKEPGSAVVRTPTDLSLIMDLSELAPRNGRALRALPITNLIFSRSLVPQLRGPIAPGTTQLVTAVMALPAGSAAAHPIRRDRRTAGGPRRRRR